MNDPEQDQALRDLETALGLRRLRPGWAKTEIFLGLVSVWLSLHVATLLGGRAGNAEDLLPSLGLFVGGGYLVMAGSRSHLYQSANRLAAYLSQRPRPSCPTDR